MPSIEAGNVPPAPPAFLRLKTVLLDRGSVQYAVAAADYLQFMAEGV
jgi:hypothetical protein